jgi:gas vesicle protein
MGVREMTSAGARIAGAVVGAVVGAAVGQLLFTESGRRSLAQARGLVEKLAGEIRHAGETAGSVVQDVMQEARRWQPLIQEVRDAFGSYQHAARGDDARFDRSAPRRH